MRNHNEHVESETRTTAPGDDHYLAGVVEFMAGIQHWTRRTEIGPNWKADSYKINPGQSTNVLGNNAQRKRILIWADSDAAGPIWISNTPINDDPDGRDRSTAVRVMPGGPQIEMHHCGALYARCSATNGAASFLRLYAEYLRA